jgi:hypothetical protein
MTGLLADVLETASRLPKDRQDNLARDFIKMLESELSRLC